jgi:Tfp pilus assembly protein PilF
MAEPQADADAAPATGPEQRAGGPEDFLRVAIEALARGDARNALHAASEACHRAPKEPKAHYAYGQAWLALNAPARAEQAFASAVQLDPNWVDAWINYGVARYRQGHIEDAKTAMRQALLRQPGHPAASANLGAFMRISGEAEAGEALLRETIRREPGNAAARLNLVADLLQDERAADALQLLDEATPPAQETRTQRHWHLQRALALLQLKSPALARAPLEAFVALGPCPPEFATLLQWRLVLLALAENDPTRAFAAAERMEQVLAAFGGQTLPEHQIMAHFDLAKFWSGRNDPARALRHWTGGHALLKLSQPFSRAAHAAFIDANIAAFDKERLESAPRAGNGDPAPVFIVGMPRSGTTLCEQILAAHRDVRGAGERTALPRAFAALGGGTDSEAAVRRVAGLDAASLDAAATTYLAELHALAPDKTRIVDKMPGNYSYIGLIALMLPAAKIIYCARDPRDIGLSIFTFRFHGHHPYAHDLADLGWTIAQHGRLMDHWRAVVPNTVITVNLSDWVNDFDGTLARVLDHVGLPADPNCARFYESDSRVRTVSYAQVRQPVNARGLGRWKAYAAGLAPLIDELQKAGMLAADADSG